ncbi:outer membrane lipoprotein-sorting protein [Microbulbifer taiwanensis]|uniref:Outer membrane lipoprotein-sorting protein n=1 Tax=Microbulbifer taiwanensis TaxID=986746 RepID=A0ABW1YVY0_9GAMM|nr:outer membrane lipoprotein-sorting protein [Microbulbifer taiwanensis]
MRNDYRLLFPVTLLCGLLSLQLQAADTGAAKGREIAVAVENRDLGYSDSVAELTMILRNRSGDETRRELEISILENRDGGDKSLIRFDFPADIRGTALLTHPQPDDADEQWLYLPAYTRIKRISSRNKSGAFVGSEFSFEDLADKEVDDFRYAYVRAEACGEGILMCDVIDRMPEDTHSAYSRQRVWVDQSAQRIFRIDYFDRKEALLKTFTAKDFRLYEDRYWRPLEVAMRNQQSGNVTILSYSRIQFQTGLSAANFHRNTLRD